jgi:hypothetical protein
MSRSVAEIADEALKLPKDDQFKLARIILDRAGPANDPGAEAAWNEENKRRIAAIDAGVTKGRTFRESLREIDTHLGRS